MMRAVLETTPLVRASEYGLIGGAESCEHMGFHHSAEALLPYDPPVLASQPGCQPCHDTEHRTERVGRHETSHHQLDL